MKNSLFVSLRRKSNTVVKADTKRRNIMKKEKLWTPSFLAIGGGSFLLFFAFYLLLPILPLYLIERFEANESTVGMVLSLYTVTALFMRPFAGFMVDTFPRKPLMLVCYAVFTAFSAVIFWRPRFLLLP